MTSCWEPKFLAFISASTLGFTEKFLRSEEFLSYTHAELLAFLQTNPSGIQENEVFNAIIRWGQAKCGSVRVEDPPSVQDIKNEIEPPGEEDLMIQIRIPSFSQAEWDVLCKTKFAGLLPLSMWQKTLFDEYFQATEEAEKGRLRQLPAMMKFNFEPRGQDFGIIQFITFETDSDTIANPVTMIQESERPPSSMFPETTRPRRTKKAPADSELMPITQQPKRRRGRPTGAKTRKVTSKKVIRKAKAVMPRLSKVRNQLPGSTSITSYFAMAVSNATVEIPPAETTGIDVNNVGSYEEKVPRYSRSTQRSARCLNSTAIKIEDPDIDCE